MGTGLLRVGRKRSVMMPHSAIKFTSEETHVGTNLRRTQSALSQLEKEVEVKKRSGDLIFKVGEKGGVSVYGLGRFPVTLYYEQWNRLLGAADDIKEVHGRE